MKHTVLKEFFPMRVFGQLLQRVGLFIPPLAIVLQLLNAISLRDMLVALVAAVSAFWLGRLIEGYATG